MDEKHSSATIPQSIPLSTGLDLVGRVHLVASEWMGKFADHQQKHAPAENETENKFAVAINQQFKKYQINHKVCGLCLLEKPRGEFYCMCKCSHDYCYSCLNSYAISKIEGLSIVICPYKECNEVMPLSSQIYKYLPDTIKIKFLQNKDTFRVDTEKEENRCQRCMQLKHPGDCQYSLEPKLVDNSFKHRECPSCGNEIYMTEGKKRVVCPECRHSMCYLCGVAWKEGDEFKHTCGMKEKVEKLERDFEGEEKCCDCEECCSKCRCDCDCCECCDGIDCGVDCTCDACRKCDNYNFCCEILFYCGGECQFPCVLWNMTSVPTRIIASVWVIAWALSAYFVAVAAVLVALVVGGITAAICAGPCKVCLDHKEKAYVYFIVCLLYPFVVLYYFFLFIK